MLLSSSSSTPLIPTRPIRAYLFDLDGTLIDSKLDLVSSVNAMLRQTGRVQLPVETVASYIGHGAAQLIADVLGPNASDADRKSGLSLFLAHYQNHKLDATRPYPGVMEGLQALGGFPCAVLTNKPAKFSMEILEALSMLKFFRGVYGADSFATKKPDPAGALSILKDFRIPPSEAAMVGDSDVDILTARNAGMFAVGVTFGFGQHDRAANPADLYVDTLVDLAPLSLQKP
jgi:phosphoglycolate phosphatase